MEATVLFDKYDTDFSYYPTRITQTVLRNLQIGKIT